MREEDRRGWEAENARLREEIVSVRESSSSPTSLSVIRFLHGSDDSPDDDSDNDLSKSEDRKKDLQADMSLARFLCLRSSQGWSQ